MREAEQAVVVRDLVKRYPKSPVNAVDGVSFEVGSGEVFGLLGPNGAGKTTTVGMLTTRVRPTGGRGDGRRRRRRRRAGPRSQLARGRAAAQQPRPRRSRSAATSPSTPPTTASRRREAEARADELLEQFGLRERGDVKPDMFSGGQAQRVMIARALMHEPQVLFLDEPTTGLDPAARLFVWDRLRELRERGVTLILTTHDMHEAANLADRVGIMDHGKLLALDTPEALMRSLPGQLDARADDPVDGSAQPEDLLAELARCRRSSGSNGSEQTRSRRGPGPDSSAGSACWRHRPAG